MFFSANLVLIRWSSVTIPAAGSLRAPANLAVSVLPFLLCPQHAWSLTWRDCTRGETSVRQRRVPSARGLSARAVTESSSRGGGRAMGTPACEKLGWHPADPLHAGYPTGVRWQRLLVPLQTSDLHYQSPEPSEAPTVSH